MRRLSGYSVAHCPPDRSSLTIQHESGGPIEDSSIVIRMLAAGVCGTDLAILSGARPGQADVLGHEGVGVIVSAPKDFRTPKGTRVIINPVHRSNPDIVIGHSRNGIFAEWFCMDVADADAGHFLVACPLECAVEDVELALAEPIASVLYSLELLRATSGGRALLIRGSGTVAIVAAKLWSRLTGSSAVLVSSSEAHAQWMRTATRWPANIRICHAAALQETIRENGSDTTFKAGILCCSRESGPEGLGFLLDFLEEGATIDLMTGFGRGYSESRLGGLALDAVRWGNVCGTSTAGPVAVLDSASRKSFFLTGHRGTAERHILSAIELLSRKIISITDVPHCRLRLEELPGVVKQMLSPQSRHDTNWVKALVAFSPDSGGEGIGDC